MYKTLDTLYRYTHCGIRVVHEQEREGLHIVRPPVVTQPTFLNLMMGTKSLECDLLLNEKCVQLKCCVF